jgi:hypothetical protein
MIMTIESNTNNNFSGKSPKKRGRKRTTIDGKGNPAVRIPVEIIPVVTLLRDLATKNKTILKTLTDVSIYINSIQDKRD